MKSLKLELKLFFFFLHRCFCRFTHFTHLLHSFQLATSMSFTKYQSPIDLADKVPVAGTRCTLSGWGLTSVNGRIPQDLLKMDQAIISPLECQQHHHPTMKMTSSHLCAFNSRGIGACQVSVQHHYSISYIWNIIDLPIFQVY